MSSTEGNKRRYKIMRNKAKKVVSETMREKADEAITELKNCPNGIYRLLR